MPPSVAILLVLFVLFVLWKACTPKWQLQVHASPGLPTQIIGGPASKRGLLADFFNNQLSVRDKFVVYAAKDRTGNLRVQFRGNLDSGTRQRIRNVLLDVL